MAIRLSGNEKVYEDEDACASEGDSSSNGKSLLWGRAVAQLRDD